MLLGAIASMGPLCTPGPLSLPRAPQAVCPRSHDLVDERAVWVTKQGPSGGQV